MPELPRPLSGPLGPFRHQTPVDRAYLRSVLREIEQREQREQRQTPAQARRLRLATSLYPDGSFRASGLALGFRAPYRPARRPPRRPLPPRARPAAWLPGCGRLLLLAAGVVIASISVWGLYVLAWLVHSALWRV